MCLRCIQSLLTRPSGPFRWHPAHRPPYCRWPSNKEFREPQSLVSLESRARRTPSGNWWAQESTCRPHGHWLSRCRASVLSDATDAAYEMIEGLTAGNFGASVCEGSSEGWPFGKFERGDFIDSAFKPLFESIICFAGTHSPGLIQHWNVRLLYWIIII